MSSLLDIIGSIILQLEEGALPDIEKARQLGMSVGMYAVLKAFNVPSEQWDSIVREQGGTLKGFPLSAPVDAENLRQTLPPMGATKQDYLRYATKALLYDEIINQRPKYPIMGRVEGVTGRISRQPLLTTYIEGIFGRNLINIFEEAGIPMTGLAPAKPWGVETPQRLGSDIESIMRSWRENFERAGPTDTVLPSFNDLLRIPQWVGFEPTLKLARRLPAPERAALLGHLVGHPQLQPMEIAQLIYETGKTDQMLEALEEATKEAKTVVPAAIREKGQIRIGEELVTPAKFAAPYGPQKYTSAYLASILPEKLTQVFAGVPFPRGWEGYAAWMAPEQFLAKQLSPLFTDRPEPFWSHPAPAYPRRGRGELRGIRGVTRRRGELTMWQRLVEEARRGAGRRPPSAPTRLA
jgi:hypothetical protein